VRCQLSGGREVEAHPRRVEQLFNSQARYVVPMFQRLYVWQENPQWLNLWEDLAEKASLQLAGKPTNPHYLGALIIEGVKPKSPREVKRFLVIDGQQRITTIQLLLCAFRDLARRHEWKDLDKITTRLLENSDPDVMETPEEEVLKLWPTTLNREVFQKIISAGGKDKIVQDFPLVRLPRKRKPEPRNGLVEAYLFFYLRIVSWIEAAEKEFSRPLEDCAYAFLQSLLQDFCVVEIVLSEGDDSQEIFYSLNSQGRALSQSDLLRSLIFMRAEKEKLDRDAIFNDYWCKFETPFWSEEVKRGGRTYSRLDLGLRYFLIAKTGVMVDARRVNEEYRRWISMEPPQYTSVRNELEDFSKYADAYYKNESLANSKLPSTDFRRVLRDFDVSTALPLFLYLEVDANVTENQRMNCYQAIESFIVRRAFVGEENKEYNKFFIEVIGFLLNHKNDDQYLALCKKLLAGGGSTRRWPSDDELMEAVISRRIYKSLSTTALRLILERVEVSYRTRKTEATDIPIDLQIEHVLPVQWGTNWALQGKAIPNSVVSWPYQVDGELAEMETLIRARNDCLHTLGNLTLVNRHLNPALSNCSFEHKLDQFKNSVLRLNRYFDSTPTWDEERILTRGKELAKTMCELWPRPVA
jgi:hypothetical protein